MTQVTLQRERFADWIDEAMPLLERHAAELNHYKDIALAVDRETYLRAEAAGMLRLYTARDPALIGYALYIVDTNAHYRGSLQARQDVLYVAPGFRGAWHGVRLVRFADADLKAEGVQVVYHHVKLEHPALGSVLRRCGYEPIEVLWGRRLDKQPMVRSAALGGEDANKAHAAEHALGLRYIEDEDAEHIDIGRSA